MSFEGNQVERWREENERSMLVVTLGGFGFLRHDGAIFGEEGALEREIERGISEEKLNECFELYSHPLPHAHEPPNTSPKDLFLVCLLLLMHLPLNANNNNANLGPLCFLGPAPIADHIPWFSNTPYRLIF